MPLLMSLAAHPPGYGSMRTIRLGIGGAQVVAFTPRLGAINQPILEPIPTRLPTDTTGRPEASSPCLELTAAIKELLSFMADCGCSWH